MGGSTVLQRVASREEATATMASPSTSPRKAPVQGRKGSIWDNLFQVDVVYQKGRK